MLFSSRPRRLPLVAGLCAGLAGAGATAGVLALADGMRSDVRNLREAALCRVVLADVGDARLGESEQLARIEPHAVTMVARGAQDRVVVEQPGVDHLRRRLGGERRHRADFELREPCGDLVLGCEPQVPAPEQRVARAPKVQATARGDDGEHEPIAGRPA